jgi:osmotically-inducible protein OsmY
MRKGIWRRLSAGVASLAVLLALAACGDRIENTDMPQPEQANVETNRQGMEGAKDESTANGVANQTATMGAAPDAAADPDAIIAAEVRKSFANDPDFGAAKIDVHSEDGVVTLRGRAPDPEAKQRAADIARNVREVKSVENLLTLG